MICHASHEACELKYILKKTVLTDVCHASHEACELKSVTRVEKYLDRMSRLA